MKNSSCADSYAELSLILLSGRGRGCGSEVGVASMCSFNVDGKTEEEDVESSELVIYS